MFEKPFNITPVTVKPTSKEDDPVQNDVTPRNEVIKTLLYSIVPIIGVTILIVVSFWMWRKVKGGSSGRDLILPLPDPTPLLPPSPVLGMSPLQLLEIKAHGRY